MKLSSVLAIAVCALLGCHVRAGGNMTVPSGGSSSPSKPAAPEAPKTSYQFGKQPGARGLTIDGADLLWVNGTSMKNDAGHTVMRAPKVGGTPKAIVTIPDSPQALTMDDSSLYFSALDTKVSINAPNGRIYKAPKAGGAATSIAEKVGELTEIEHNDGFLYFSTYSALSRMPKAGGTPTVLDGKLRNYRSIVIDDKNVYFSAGDATATWVWSIPKAGGTPVKVSPHGGAAVIALHGDGLVYVAGYKAYRSQRDGSNPTLLGDVPLADQILVAGNTLYGAAGNNGTVWSLPLAGGTATKLAKVEFSRTGLAADETSFYWADGTTGVISRVAR